jgi:trk system potassium uptake protein
LTEADDVNVVIMGSGRTGSLLAAMLTAADHDVTVIDWDSDSFSRLPDDFPGRTLLGNAMDYDVLRRAGIEAADAFVAATSGDNRNIMASEVAKEVFHVSKVIARIKDPNRAHFFSKLGLQSDCRTTLGAQAVLDLVQGWASEQAS